MKLYTAHWLEDRKAFQSLGLISSVTSMAWIRSLLSSRFGVAAPLPAPSSCQPQEFTASLLQHQDEAAGTQSLRCENPVLCWRSSVSGEKHVYPIRLRNLCSQKGRGHRVLAGNAGDRWNIYLGSTINVI